MKAMILESPGPVEGAPLRLAEQPMPLPGAGEVRVRVACCAVCRTDLHVIEGELAEPRLPLIPGHMVVGTVEALGPGCKRLQIGRRVGIAWLRHTCGTCEYCASQRENLCPDSRFTGYQEDGGYAEFAIVPEEFGYEIPDTFTDIAAAPLLCSGIIGYRALHRCNPPENARLLLAGFGSSAHIVLQIAVHRGYEVFVTSRTDSHCRLAIELGATWAGRTVSAAPASVDSAILFAPVGTLVPPVLEKLKPGGTLAIAGIYMTPVPELDYNRHLFLERDVRTVTSNTRQDARQLLVEAAAANVTPRTHAYPLADANRALQDLKHSRIDGTAVLVMETR